MTRTIEHEAHELLRRGREARRGAISEADLDGLPDPIRRYLSYAGVVGTVPIRTVRLKQRGALSLAEGSRWLPFTAEQYVRTNPPAFLWHATLHPVPLVSVAATDAFAAGHGALVIKALSVVPLGMSRGPEVDQGELLRYLGETAWFPTALLSDDIRWDAIDSSRAKATIAVSGITASGIFHIDAQGRYTHFTADRYREEHKRQVPRPWTGRWDDDRVIDGLRVPLKADAAYTLEAGEVGYFRGEVTQIEYNQSVPY